MKIIESRASFELSVVLTDIEVLIYREVFRSQKPVTIPEFNNEKFLIKEITPLSGRGRGRKLLAFGHTGRSEEVASGPSFRRPIGSQEYLTQEFDDAGKLVRFAVNYDMQDFMRQLGMGYCQND